MYTMVIVTQKANHNLHFKQSAAATAAFRQLAKARREWAVTRETSIRPGDAAKSRFHQVEDDYDTVADLDLQEVVTVQVGSMEQEKVIEKEIAIISLHGDISKGEAINSDGKLREAQARNNARTSLALPGRPQ